MLETEIVMTACNADDGDPAGLFTKMMFFKEAGDFIPGHLHPYDHPTLFAKGKFEIDVDGEKQVIDTAIKPVVMVIRKDKRHRITALTEGAVAFCIHIVRNPEGEIAGPGNYHVSELMPQIVIADSAKPA